MEYCKMAYPSDRPRRLRSSPLLRRLVREAGYKTKIAVEIDGTSHSRQRREADQRKTFFLESIGWTVLRFRVPFDYDKAASRCVAASSSTQDGSTT